MSVIRIGRFPRSGVAEDPPPAVASMPIRAPEYAGAGVMIGVDTARPVGCLRERHRLNALNGLRKSGSK
jgi:hypothetical protein